jgi:ubiquinone biosynthesis protein Coq4
MIIYCKFKKKAPWNITTEQLLDMERNTFGYALGNLLHSNGFELIPKVERHDAYHLLTGFGTSVKDEIALQYCCFANGKRTPYLFGVLFLGTLLLPDYIPYYKKAFQYGKQANSFYHFDFKQILPLDYTGFSQSIFTDSEQIKMKSYRKQKHITF